MLDFMKWKQKNVSKPDEKILPAVYAKLQYVQTIEEVISLIAQIEKLPTKKLGQIFVKEWFYILYSEYQSLPKNERIQIHKQLFDMAKTIENGITNMQQVIQQFIFTVVDDVKAYNQDHDKQFERPKYAIASILQYIPSKKKSEYKGEFGDQGVQRIYRGVSYIVLKEFVLYWDSLVAVENKTKDLEYHRQLVHSLML